MQTHGRSSNELAGAPSDKLRISLATSTPRRTGAPHRSGTSTKTLVRIIRILANYRNRINPLGSVTHLSLCSKLSQLVGLRGPCRGLAGDDVDDERGEMPTGFRNFVSPIRISRGTELRHDEIAYRGDYWVTMKVYRV